MKIFKISSLDSPELYPYRTLKRAVEHIKKGLFVAEGEKVVVRLLKSKLEICSFLLSEEWFGIIKEQITKKCSDQTPVFVGSKKLLESIVGFDLHQGIMAVGKIPEKSNLSEVLNSKKSSLFLVAIDGLTNSDNIGVIVRNCVAFDVDGLIVGETSSSPYLRRAIRQSMGAVFDLKIIESKNLAGDLEKISRENSFTVLAADPHGERKLSDNFHSSKNVCLVLGSEGYGIRKEVLAVCNEKVSIPINPKVDSLNVASASAIFLYEINQRL